MALRTVRDAAARLGVGYSTLKLWIRQGHARSTTTAGGHHRLSDAEIDRLSAHVSPEAPGRRPPAVGPEYLEGLSARNRLRGYVEEVRIDGLLGQVRMRIGDDHLTAIITRDAIEALGLKRGDDAFAIVKSTEVMIARASAAPLRRSSRRPAKK